MIVDCHVHTCATLPGHGKVSRRLRRRPNMLVMRVRLGVTLFGSDEQFKRDAEVKLLTTVAGTPELDAAVVLAFDGVYTEDGRYDDDATDLLLTNDYVAGLARASPKVLFGASIHPYRTDAVAELERCVAAGAVLVKWLPPVQGMDPADDRCRPFYEALAHHRVPLLSHTGGEMALPMIFPQYRDPALLKPALKAGVTVIAAHCGTRSHPFETDYLPTFLRMAREHERLYGDTSSLCVPTRSYAFDHVLKDDAVRAKLVHGSDWPIISLPPTRIGLRKAARLLVSEGNWMRRDVLVKRELGLGDDYWHRAATLLRLPPGPAA